MGAEPDLASLLEGTRRALLAGQVDQLDRLCARTEAAIVSGLPRDLAVLQGIRQQAEANARLLQAALKGVAAARRRLAEVSGDGRFSTYDASGRRGQLGVDGARPTRRL